MELSFVLFRWLFPVRADEASEPPLTAHERRVYGRWEIGSLLPFFLFVPTLSYLWYLALLGAASLLPHETPDTRFVLLPIPILWGFPAVLLGIVTSIIPLTGLYLALLGDRYRRYLRCCDERVGFNGEQAFAWLALAFVGGSVVFSVIGVKTFTRFTETGVEISRPLSVRSSFYEYTRVRSIEHRATLKAPNGNTVQHPHYVIIFDDGASWSTCDGLRDPVPELDGRITKLVSLRSRRAIVERR